MLWLLLTAKRKSAKHEIMKSLQHSANGWSLIRVDGLDHLSPDITVDGVEMYFKRVLFTQVIDLYS